MYLNKLHWSKSWRPVYFNITTNDMIYNDFLKGLRIFVFMTQQFVGQMQYALYTRAQFVNIIRMEWIFLLKFLFVCFMYILVSVKKTGELKVYTRLSW